MDIHDWHWIVGGEESRFWSSKIGSYVEDLAEGAGVTRILNEQELTDVLSSYGLPGPVFRFPTLKPYQWDAILDISGMRATAESTIDTLSEPDRTVARARMQKSLSYDRFDPLLIGMASAAQLTDTEVNTLWLWAADL